MATLATMATAKQAALRARHAALLVCDVQERFRPILFGGEPAIAATRLAVRGACALDVPVVVTEQYPKALGHTVSDVRECLPEGTRTYEKLRFSMCTDDVREELRRLRVSQVLLCGVEAHVCVVQTALDLLRDGVDVHLLVDAVTSQRSLDRAVAVRCMVRAGCVPTTAEMALFEMLGEASGDTFKTISKLVREDRPCPPPEFASL